MRLRSFLLVLAVAAVVEVVAVKYWVDNTGFDCWPNCDTGQTVSGWTLGIVPLALAALLVVSIVRWLFSRRSGTAPRR